MPDIPVLVAHEPGCSLRGHRGHTDAAKRCADAVNLHRFALGYAAVGRWVAVRLADGSSDGTLYDTKHDAIRHQADEYLCAYIRLVPRAMSVCAAESVLRWHRMSYDAGAHRNLVDASDPRGGRELIPRITTEDHRRQVAALIAGGRS